jgi:hypothetical protein
MVRFARVLCVAVAAVLGGVSSAWAWEVPVPTKQHVQANAAFLIYAPAPAERGAVCFVDSGLDVNADTEPGVLARLAWDGQPTVDDGDVYKHGSHMASVAGAAVNGWGSVGAWPQLGLVSVRASDPDPRNPENFVFPFRRYSRAIRQCVRAQELLGFPIRVINMSLGGARTPDPEELKRLRDMVVQARNDYGINVVASAGNSEGPVFFPARVDEVFAVGGADPAGQICPKFASGEGMDLLAPGCPVQLLLLSSNRPAEMGGTSPAAAFTSGVLAALRSYRPDLTVEQAETLVTSTASAGSLNAEAAFRAAGLGWVVDQGNAALAAARSASSAGTAAPAGAAPAARKRRLATPRPKITFGRGVLRVSVARLPKGAALEVTVRARRVNRPRRMSKKRFERNSTQLVVRDFLRGRRLREVRVRVVPDEQHGDVLAPSETVKRTYR